MKITVTTSGPALVDAVRALCGRDVVCPEAKWVHPRTRLRELVKLVQAGKDLDLLTWDELTLDLALSVSATKLADVEVRYFNQVSEPIVLEARGGSLAGWPDPHGFFTERDAVLFDEHLFDGPLTDEDEEGR